MPVPAGPPRLPLASAGDVPCIAGPATLGCRALLLGGGRSGRWLRRLAAPANHPVRCRRRVWFTRGVESPHWHVGKGAGSSPRPHSGEWPQQARRGRVAWERPWKAWECAHTAARPHRPGGKHQRLGGQSAQGIPAVTNHPGIRAKESPRGLGVSCWEVDCCEAMERGQGGRCFPAFAVSC